MSALADYDIADFVGRKYKNDLSKFMDDMANPLIGAPIEWPEVHMFLGDIREPKPRAQDHILCLKAVGTISTEFMKDNVMDVTLVKDDVTCKSCLEWMHA